MEIINKIGLEFSVLNEIEKELVEKFVEKINAELVAEFRRKPYNSEIILKGDLADQLRSFNLACQSAFFSIARNGNWENIELKILMRVDGEKVEEENLLVFSLLT